MNCSWTLRRNSNSERTESMGGKQAAKKTTAWAMKISEKEVIAFAPQCPHLGCAYHWNVAKHEFLCPCHASTFSIQGEVLTGPAPRGLDRYKLKIEEDKLRWGLYTSRERIPHEAQT